MQDLLPARSDVKLVRWPFEAARRDQVPPGRGAVPAGGRGRRETTGVHRPARGLGQGADQQGRPGGATGSARSDRAQPPPAPDGPERHDPLRQPLGKDWLELSGIEVHNVRGADIRIPVGRLTCLTGVSGSGKSSVLHHALATSMEAVLAGGEPVNAAKLLGAQDFGWLAVVDQDPIGRTPRSNPATYSKAYDLIRTLFAGTPEAKERSLSATAFSFNTAGGRCETCTGYGKRQVDMHFLPDVWVTCDVCDGRRFGPDVLAVTYDDATIDQVLEMTIEQAAEFFTQPPQLATVLDALVRVGLGYVALGQSATELSGGEAQRLKLANALVRGAKGGKRGLVLLDEPVTGLHPADVERLVACLDALLDKKNTVVVAEHDLHLAAVADWIVDMGPAAGADGGRVINQGAVADIIGGAGPTVAYLRKVITT
ncbi:hypothetical protein [Kibdelosporangium phytohabitans]|uniref:hypothetical protein n=1 Tax=Kibdelosporangium phytohabitans TaxID=860235 RepID=UPI00178AA88F|nr:hypothetical protein [Kibdelosporangium phytohabitans]MBE1462144.1 excinuclease ABC subunit A [Kibdelosporangium phytohabitans]